MTGAELIERMAAVYAGARSYADRGVVTTTYPRPDGSPRVTHLSFETRFIRPDRFRFEFRDDEERHAVWLAGERAQWTWTLMPGIHETTLEMALGGATGISSGAAHTIPRLLLPNTIRGSSLAETVAQIEASEDIDGVACHRVLCEHARMGRSHLWVCQRTLLVRRIVEPAPLETVTTYTPELDPDLTNSDFGGPTDLAGTCAGPSCRLS